MDSIVKTYQPPTPPLAAAEGRPRTAQHTSGTIHPVMSEPAFDHDEKSPGSWRRRHRERGWVPDRREVDDFGEVVRTRCVAAAVWIGVVECASSSTRTRPAGAWSRPAVFAADPDPPRCRRPARDRDAAIPRRPDRARTREPTGSWSRALSGRPPGGTRDWPATSRRCPLRKTGGP